MTELIVSRLGAAASVQTDGIPRFHGDGGSAGGSHLNPGGCVLGVCSPPQTQAGVNVEWKDEPDSQQASSVLAS